MKRAYTPGDRVEHQDGTLGTIVSQYPDGTITVEWDEGPITELEPYEQALDLKREDGSMRVKTITAAQYDDMCAIVDSAKMDGDLDTGCYADAILDALKLEVEEVLS